MMANRITLENDLRNNRKRRRVGGSRRGDRSAFLLVLVMLVIAIAGLAALNFSNSMLTSHEISQFSGAQLKAKMCAESGVQSVRLFVAYDRASRLGMGGSWDNPSRFQALNVIPDLDPKRRGNFTVISPSLDETGNFGGLRYGLQNESAKINLNTLAQLDKLASSGALAASAMSGLGLGSSGGAGGQLLGGGGGGQLLGASGGNANGQNGGQNSNQNSGQSQNPSQNSSQNIQQNNSQSSNQANGQNNRQSGGQMMGGTGSGSLASASGSLGGASQLASIAGAASGNMAQTLLMGLPGMTEDVADAILDWLDEDEEPRAMGAEFADYYQQLQPTYKPANGPVQSVEQLLLVRGVTPQLLFGYDENRNGVLDSGEQTKLSLGIPPGTPPGQLPVPNSDPNVLPPPPLGWAPYLTLHSQEKNVTSDGLARVNLNSQDLQALYDELMSVLGNETYASFIVAYRQFGKQSTGANPLSGLMNSSSVLEIPSSELLVQKQIEHVEAPVTRPRAFTVELAPTSRVGYVSMALQQRRGGQGGFGPGGGGQGGGGFGGGQGGGGQGGGGFGPRGGQGGGQGGFGPGRGGQGAQGGGPGGQGGGGRGGQGAGGQGGGGRGGNGDGPGGGRGGNGGGGRGEDGDGQGGGRGGNGGRGNGGQGGGQGGGGGAAQSPPKPWTAAAMSSIDLSQQGSVQFKQVLDLVDATVTINENGQQTVYTSPFSSLPLDVANYSPILMDKLTTVDAKTIPGRINIMECPREVLLGLPGITPEVGEQILQARVDGSQSETRNFETWLVAEGYVTMDQMRTLMPLVTCGGDVFKAQVIGYLEGSAAASRVEAIVSGAGDVPEVLFFRRLDHLGRAFDVPTLGQRFDAGMNSGLSLQ